MPLGHSPPAAVADVGVVPVVGVEDVEAVVAVEVVDVVGDVTAGGVHVELPDALVAVAVVGVDAPDDGAAPPPLVVAVAAVLAVVRNPSAVVAIPESALAPVRVLEPPGQLVDVAVVGVLAVGTEGKLPVFAPPVDVLLVSSSTGVVELEDFEGRLACSARMKTTPRVTRPRMARNGIQGNPRRRSSCD